LVTAFYDFDFVTRLVLWAKLDGAEALALDSGLTLS
jgi:hypothetical protein